MFKRIRVRGTSNFNIDTVYINENDTLDDLKKKILQLPAHKNHSYSSLHILQSGVVLKANDDVKLLTENTTVIVIVDTELKNKVNSPMLIQNSQKMAEMAEYGLENMDKEAVEKGYVCSISLDIMKDPVTLLETVQTYEKESIKKWLATHNTCPMTNKRLTSKQFYPNTGLREEITEWKQKKEKEKEIELVKLIKEKEKFSNNAKLSTNKSAKFQSQEYCIIATSKKLDVYLYKQANIPKGRILDSRERIEKALRIVLRIDESYEVKFKGWNGQNDRDGHKVQIPKRYLQKFYDINDKFNKLEQAFKKPSTNVKCTIQ